MPPPPLQPRAHNRLLVKHDHCPPVVAHFSGLSNFHERGPEPSEEGGLDQCAAVYTCMNCCAITAQVDLQRKLHAGRRGAGGGVLSNKQNCTQKEKEGG